MLKQRLLTAAILIPFVVFSILYLDSFIVQILLAIVVLLAGVEWFNMLGFQSKKSTATGLLCLLLIAGVLYFLPVTLFMTVSLFIWLAIMVLIFRYAHIALPARLQHYFLNSTIALIIASVVLSLFWCSAAYLHKMALGPQQLLYVMVLVWLADTGGYFAGKKWGKTPLAKAVSPNKTWQGVMGALVLGSLWAILAYVWRLAGELSFISWLLVSLLALSISIIGDLFESLFKRLHDVKDSGTLLPGHGGLLDRIDSMIAAVPVFSASLYFLSLY